MSRMELRVFLDQLEITAPLLTTTCMDSVSTLALARDSREGISSTPYVAVCLVHCLKQCVYLHH